jgi:hypothetical protein
MKPFHLALNGALLYLFSWINIILSFIMIIKAVIDLINSGNSYGYLFAIASLLIITAKYLRFKTY